LAKENQLVGVAVTRHRAGIAGAAGNAMPRPLRIAPDVERGDAVGAQEDDAAIIKVAIADSAAGRRPT